MKKFEKVRDILDNSDKAELLEKLSEILDTPGSKMVVITGVPNMETGGLFVEVFQTGHQYRYEEWGFIMEGATIVESCNGESSSEEVEG